MIFLTEAGGSRILRFHPLSTPVVFHLFRAYAHATSFRRLWRSCEGSQAVDCGKIREIILGEKELPLQTINLGEDSFREAYGAADQGLSPRTGGVTH
jgi:hypothetical protein